MQYSQKNFMRIIGNDCMKQKHLHSTIGPAHAPNQHTQYVTLPFSYIELIVSGLYMLSREPGCARLYHTWRCEQ